MRVFFRPCQPERCRRRRVGDWTAETATKGRYAVNEETRQGKETEAVAAKLVFLHGLVAQAHALLDAAHTEHDIAAHDGGCGTLRGGCSTCEATGEWMRNERRLHPETAVEGGPPESTTTDYVLLERALHAIEHWLDAIEHKDPKEGRGATDRGDRHVRDPRRAARARRTLVASTVTDEEERQRSHFELEADRRIANAQSRTSRRATRQVG